MAQNAIAQGLATHQNTIMGLYADIARQCLGNRVVYSPNQEFPITNLGQYSSITIQQMALDAVIDVKSKMASKIEQRQSAANALAMLGSMGKGIQVSNEGAAFLMQKALYDLVPRKMAETFVKEAGPDPQELALAQQSAQNDALALQQNQQMYQANPLPYEVQETMRTSSPDEIDDAIKQLGNPPEEESGVELLDMEQQPGSFALDIEGQTSDLGSSLANAGGI